jgi:DNA-binding NtrC family response regulator
MAGATLFSFIDPKDPFMEAEIAGEEQPGPILSLLGARCFDTLHLFYTPSMLANAKATESEIRNRYTGLSTEMHSLEVADPKDYSAVMGGLGRTIRGILAGDEAGDYFVCVSSGTAEMRAVWFLLTGARILPATLLQVGSPIQPLWGASNVKEVRFDAGEWSSLRDLLMPMDFFGAAETPFRSRRQRLDSEVPMAAAPPESPAGPYPELDAALQELGIFVGSAVVRNAAERAAVAAESEYPVLFSGETGTGKELFARLVHRLSDRRDKQLIPINCGAIPKELVESYLFGHRKGAFTGAASDQQGKFEQADGGTLFLDEIGELPPDAQSKLLRILQDGIVEPIGSGKPRRVDVRIIAATNRNLRHEISEGRFREDLFYRLDVVQVPLPALRERRGEIPQLAAALMKQINQRRIRPRQLSKDALRRLELHAWPGNVRELENVLRRSVLYASADVLEAGDLLIGEASASDTLAALPEPVPGFSMQAFLENARLHLISRALEKTNGNQSAAAALLGVTKQAISKYMNDKAG